MAVSSPSTAAGGVLIALGALAGAAIGLVLGEPTPGLLIGLALGSLAAVLVWLRDLRTR